jgi:hypothetical protein
MHLGGPSFRLVQARRHSLSLIRSSRLPRSVVTVHLPSLHTQVFSLVLAVAKSARLVILVVAHSSLLLSSCLEMHS